MTEDSRYIEKIPNRTMTHTDTDIAEILKRFRENCNKTFWKGGFIDDNDDTFRIESIEDFITRECLALKKKWERERFDNQ